MATISPFRITREDVGLIPGGSLTTGKAFQLSGDRNDCVLIYNADRHGRIAFYDLRNHRITQQDSFTFGTTSSPNNVSLVQDRYILISTTGDFRCFDTREKRAQYIPRSNYTRRCVSSTILPCRNGIYAIGGRDRLNNALKTDFEFLSWANVARGHSRDHWETRMPILIARKNATAVATANSTVYLIGGYQWYRQRGRYTACSQVEIYDGNQWNLGPPLHHARESPCVVVLQDRYIVVLGGTNNGQTVRQVEVWDTETLGFVVWSTIELPRTEFSAIAYENDIYLFCGNRTIVEKLTLNLGEASLDGADVSVVPESALGIPTSQYADEDDRSEQSFTPPTTPPTTDDEDEPTLGNNPRLFRHAKYLPSPPIRPVLPKTAYLNVLERYEALKNYSKRLEKLQEEYTEVIKASTERISKAYDKARDQAIEEVEERRQLWAHDTERLVSNARKEMESLRPMVDRDQEFIFAYLKEVDEDNFEDDIPSQLRCPITLNLMKDPVVAADGNVYERFALEQWFRNQPGKTPRSPLTGGELPSKQYYPVHSLKTLCQQFARHHYGAKGMAATS